MVVTAKEVLKKLTKEDETAIKNLEGKIDTALIGEQFSVAVPSGLTSRVKRQIKAIYRNAGWKVTYSYDQRDGAYWNFQPRKESRPTHSDGGPYGCGGPGPYQQGE